MSKIDLTQEAFRLYLKAFAEHAPEFVAALPPGAPEHLLDALPKVEGLRVLYGIHDGAFTGDAPTHQTKLFRHTHFLPLEGGHGALALGRSFAQDLPDLFPFASNFHGHVHALWLQGDRAGQVYELDPREGPRFVAPSLGAWFKAQTQLLLSGTWKPKDQHLRSGSVRFTLPQEIPLGKPFVVRMIGGHAIEFARHRVSRRELQDLLDHLEVPYEPKKLAQKSFLWAFSLHTPGPPQALSFLWHLDTVARSAPQGTYLRKTLSHPQDEVVHYTVAPSLPVGLMELEVQFDYLS